MRCMSSSSNSRNATRRHTFWFRNPAHEEIAFPHEEKQNAHEEIAFPDFRRAVFEAGLKDPKNDSGRCGSVRLTRPFRNAPNRCPVRDSSQKERPTLEFFSQER